MPEDLRISMDMPPVVYSASRFILYCVWIIG